MKKLVIRPIVVFVLLATVFVHGYSQITVSKITDNSTISPDNGFIYSLPKTVFRIDIVYEKLEKIKGPLSEYSEEYLGANDFISSDLTEYNLVDVNLSTFEESDPDELYYVKFPLERSKDAKAISFSLSEIGGLLAYNTEQQISISNTEIISDQTLIFEKGDKAFPYMSQYNKQKKTDTIIRTINIDTVTINRFLFKSSWVDKSTDDKAKEAALQIERIRESRYNLISGYQEVNYGSSIIYMDAQMSKLETQYLELFLGREIKTIEKETFFFVPGKNNTGGELLRFDDGKSVRIKITPNSKSDILPLVSNSIVNSVFYRLPASSNVEVNSNGKNYFTGRYIVNQLGTISTVSLDNTKLQFDSETGNLINMVRD